MCERHDDLLADYQRTVRTFTMALDALQAAIAIAPGDEYDHIREYVEEARMISEQARINLERHDREHGCQDHPKPTTEPCLRRLHASTLPRTRTF